MIEVKQLKGLDMNKCFLHTPVVSKRNVFKSNGVKYDTF